MRKALAQTNEHYETSSGRTPEYLSWHRTFKREFTKFLTEKGATSIEIGKPNHFDISGFFVVDNQTWYFRIEDIRWSKTDMLIRTAKSNKDYTGGRNQSIPLNKGITAFQMGFDSIVLRVTPESVGFGAIINTSVNAAPELKYP